MQLQMSNPQDIYRRQRILTASPIELIVLLYEGLKKDLVLGKKSILRSDFSSAHKYLMNAQDIVSELINCLDMSISLSKELLSIYEFILKEIREINISKDPAQIDPLAEIVDNLKNTWQEVGESQRGTLALNE